MSHAPACQIGLIKSAACQNNQHVKPQQQSNRSGTSNHTHHPQHIITFSVSNRSKSILPACHLKCQEIDQHIKTPSTQRPACLKSSSMSSRSIDQTTAAAAAHQTSSTAAAYQNVQHVKPQHIRPPAAHQTSSIAAADQTASSTQGGIDFFLSDDIESVTDAAVVWFNATDAHRYQ